MYPFPVSLLLNVVLVYDPGMDKEICLACLGSENHAREFSFEPCIYMHLIANDELEFLAVDYIFVVSFVFVQQKGKISQDFSCINESSYLRPILVPRKTTQSHLLVAGDQNDTWPTATPRH